jgi:hypothetical protein
MPRPHPTWIYHITHLDNLPGIIAAGLRCDRDAAGTGLTTDIGNARIKERRRATRVGTRPGGVVADYVPFYFAPRSPMLFAICRGNVPTYQRGADGIVYLLCDLDGLLQAGHPIVFTDRNAVLENSYHFAAVEELDDEIDWELMERRQWANTASEPDRKERRMAEALVHEAVPWEAVAGVAVHDPAAAAAVAGLIADSRHHPHLAIKPEWYF